MSDVNKLRSKVTAKIHAAYSKMTEKGINLAARVPVVLQEVQLANYDKHKRTYTGEPTVMRTEILVVTELKIGQIRRHIDGALVTVGDVYFETPQHGITRAVLEGSELPETQVLRYEIDGEQYTPINGGIQDPDGLTWRVTLEKVPS